MKKVFWSVEQAVWGADKPRIEWFDSLEAAKKFAERDYTGFPVRHVYTSARTISAAEKACELTKLYGWD